MQFSRSTMYRMLGNDAAAVECERAEVAERDTSRWAQLSSVVLQLADNISSLHVSVSAENAEFLTVKQAARKYNLGERTIYRMVEDGLRVARVGKAIRIKPRDLAKWLEESETLLR